MTDLQKEVIQLKKDRNALVLAHNYQPFEIQQVADFVGDSLQLARKSAEVTGYDLIVFAGVRFMAEMTAILAENIPVYIPAPDALCPLAAFVDLEKLRKQKEQYPDAPVVVYVNTTAETKSECDVICTSGNAVEVVTSLGAERVLFGPDKNLAEYVRRQTGVELIDIEPRGHCYVHQQFDVAQIELAREEHPNAIVIVHPECPPEVQDAADIVGSTGAMVRIVAESPEKEFIIATELGLIEQLQAAHPDKKIIPAYSKAVCRQMKKNTLEKLYAVLKDLPKENIVTVPAEMAIHIREILGNMNKVPDKQKGAATV
ncbi:MAG: quinolinate synthase NadA [Candidatus Thorarchaeota archaeon]|nr:quinolinate synthase NadA [Candidatus Thorarchaeota archaeon]